ncbi:MAG: 30S ribosomal protein S6 [Chloroflexi bacterium]|nr:30S ribosomal protein S6 [Chloroflexota bacterium]
MPSREYELTAVYDLAVAEAGGPDASVAALTAHVEARGGKVIRVDHWGRRRMAYPIGRAIDADYIVSRIEIDPVSVSPLEATLRIDEKVLRHLVVRADELPVPPPPREPRQAPVVAAPVAEAPAVVEAAPVAEAPAETPAAVEEAAVAEAPAEAPAVVDEAAVAEAPATVEEAPVVEAPAASTGDAEESVAEASGGDTIAAEEPGA